MKIKPFIFLACSLLALPINAEEFIFGVVPQFEARKLYQTWKPILKVLQEKTGHTFTMQGTESIPEFEKEFMNGSYDFAYMNPWHSLMAFKQQGYLPLVKDGIRKLQGILVAPKNSEISSIQQLDGKQIAFPAPNALGASLLMRTELQNKHRLNIQPIYVGTHSSVYLNVILKQAAAGGGVMRTLKKQDPKLQSLLQIIYKTENIAPHPISAHPRVPKPVIEQVKLAFLAMKDDPEQQKLIEKIPMKSPVIATVDDYKPLEAMGLDSFYVAH